MHGSRKYPYAPKEDFWKFQDGGGLKDTFFVLKYRRLGKGEGRSFKQK